MKNSKPSSKSKLASKKGAKTFKVTIANVPFDATLAIAEYILQWEEEPMNAVGLHENIKPEGAGRGKR